MFAFRVVSHGGKDNWITGKMQKNPEDVEGNSSLVEVDKQTYDSLDENVDNGLELTGPPGSAETAPRLQSDGSIQMESTGTNLPPEPPTAYDKINNYFINKEGSTDAGLDRVDSLMSNYPTADRAISNEAYDIAKNRIDKAESDGEVTSTEASDLKDILDGK